MDTHQELEAKIPEAVRVRLRGLSAEEREKFYRLLARLETTAHVITAPSGTQYILPIDILLSPKVFDEMQKLTEAVNKSREAVSASA
ncbi:MAG TPA: hypothetical protein VF397_05325 [Pyrinomonadaceae bacterium]